MFKEIHTKYCALNRIGGGPCDCEAIKPQPFTLEQGYIMHKVDGLFELTQAVKELTEVLRSKKKK